MWHGLLTVPFFLTAGLKNPVETCGQATWHGQETLPQHGFALKNLKR